MEGMTEQTGGAGLSAGPAALVRRMKPQGVLCRMLPLCPQSGCHPRIPSWQPEDEVGVLHPTSAAGSRQLLLGQWEGEGGRSESVRGDEESHAEHTHEGRENSVNHKALRKKN